MRVYLNGEFLPLIEARISPLDRGFLFGDGVYDVVPFYNHEPFLLEEHLARLDRSLKAIDMENPLSHAEWAEVIHKLSDETPIDNYAIYLQVTRGTGVTRQHTYSDDLTPTVFAMQVNPKALPPEAKENGVSAITLKDERWENCYIKSINLLPNILALQQSKNQGAYETILIKNGFLTEGSGSNIFVIKNNVIMTAPQTPHILAGITRGFVLQLAKQHQLPFEERFISEDELNNADEIWMTSSTREVLAITRLNGKIVGDGKIGPLCKKMHHFFQVAKE